MRGGRLEHVLRVLSLMGLTVWLPSAFAQTVESSAPRQAQAVKITVLSTMLADAGIGEWGEGN
jgi:hypothetical protein